MRPGLRRQSRTKPGLRACGELSGVMTEAPVCRGSVHQSKMMAVTGYVNPSTINRAQEARRVIRAAPIAPIPRQLD